MELRKRLFTIASGLGITFALSLALVTPSLFSQQSSRPSDVLGLAYNIETAYARARANGAITVSEGGIIDYNKGKAALIRDPDVGAYIMLWQPPR